MLRTVIFDLDGTLIDSKSDIIDSLSYAYKSCRGVELPTDSLKIGPPLEDMLSSISSGLSGIEISEIILSFRSEYKSSNFPKTKCYEGIAPMLFSLQQHKCTLIIATNKPFLIAKQILRVTGMDLFGDNIIAIDSFVGRKLTKANMLTELIAKHLINKKDCIFVGDSPLDINAAKLVGLRSVAVGYGYSGKEELTQCNPDYYVETVNELSELILNTLN